ncbi:MAG TPA: hypothetical protein VFQ71_07740 [Gaiellales bacterium]|jgi:hypothetical protein|nr:hypothetical protein [Gaiellales bacterium]
MSDEAPATDLGAVFEAHVRRGFEDRDVDGPALVPAVGVAQAGEPLKLQRG